jgi:hypothetical protein
MIVTLMCQLWWRERMRRALMALPAYVLKVVLQIAGAPLRAPLFRVEAKRLDRPGNAKFAFPLDS